MAIARPKMKNQPSVTEQAQALPARRVSSLRR
jgi:hypothetical protein